jgi:flagellar hook assembly protein FlgD
MFKIGKPAKSIAALLLVLILAVVNFSFFAVKAHAADDKYIEQIYVGQPTDSTSEYYNRALYVKVHVVGYKGKNLRIRIKSSDGKEVATMKLSKAVSDNTNYNYYWDGKDSKGNYYKDGTYTIQTWIYGDDSTLVTRTYKLDLKGNTAAATAKSFKCTYMGQPKDTDIDYAFEAIIDVKGYKGKKFYAYLYGPDGNLVLYKENNIKYDKNDWHIYYDGFDDDGYWSGNGKYTIEIWTDGVSSKSWHKEVTLKGSGNG